MILKEFLESGISYKVHKDDMPQFLEECKAKGLKWWFKLGDHHPKAIVFNPFDFYSEQLHLDLEKAKERWRKLESEVKK